MLKELKSMGFSAKEVNNVGLISTFFQTLVYIIKKKIILHLWYDTTLFFVD